ncbi:MAG: SGNH/GDSL hydrolase family protein [Lentisphaerales bacterium]|nr:SGNH/GDSL hydrolase family protein [Lentisphaerales bacterium]
MKLLLILFFTLVLNLSATQKIEATDERLTITGAKYTFVKDGMVIPQRHSTEILKMSKSQLAFDPVKAQTTTGVVLKFKTNSESIKFFFKAIEGENRGSEYAVFENGTLKLEQRFPKSKPEHSFEITRTNSDLAEIEVSLPSWSKVAFSRIEISKGASLEKTSPKKTYAAFGDSISHGTGQGSATYKTWPFLLSRKLNSDLYNLAVGGGKVSVPAAGLLKGFSKVDIITLLIGYNDMNSGISPTEFAAKYKEFLTIATKAQPSATIYCISPLYTKTQKSKNKNSDHTIDEFRQAVISTVKNFQKSSQSVKLIIGHDISSEKNLREGSTDPVHLGIPGAKMLAEELSKIIK